jgi:hypothetical protein
VSNEDLAREAAEKASRAICGRDGYVDRIQPAVLAAITRAVEASTWSCPQCAFTFDKGHTNADGSGFTCPQCVVEDKDEEIAQLKEEIAGNLALLDASAFGATQVQQERERAIEAAREEEREAIRADVAAALAYTGHNFRTPHGAGCNCLSCAHQISRESAAKRADDAIRARSKVQP